MIALALVVALVPLKFPGILVKGGFVTPSRNIACNVGPLGKGGAPAIGCSLFSASSPQGTATWWMAATGRAHFAYAKADPATDFRTLRYGWKYSWRGLACVSARDGLTCRNKSKHGFFLSRQKQRIF